MNEQTTESKQAAMVRLVKEIKVICEPPDELAYIARFWNKNDQDFLARYGEKLEEWVAEFHAFIRDHRSRDPVTLRIVREQYDACSLCGTPWETFTDPEANGNDKPHCAGCGAQVADGNPHRP